MLHLRRASELWSLSVWETYQRTWSRLLSVKFTPLSLRIVYDATAIRNLGMMLQQLPDDTFSHTTYAYPSVRAAWSVALAFLWLFLVPLVPPPKVRLRVTHFCRWKVNPNSQPTNLFGCAGVCLPKSNSNSQ